MTSRKESTKRKKSVHGSQNGDSINGSTPRSNKDDLKSLKPLPRKKSVGKSISNNDSSHNLVDKLIKEIITKYKIPKGKSVPAGKTPDKETMMSEINTLAGLLLDS
eukprot:CAMPEP_0116879468 /NCGR_PEP_ID=MMETSP0463-20121206/11285_1 /TAXON_ID=181622 /ORGANISM="Strombidinopsis sp, Strain SopsisLIS2011" /LENGTH=105 /DNA_ID=CAMNT_0004528853 /DNA_START=133 /DNA_END=450 /DNA_ORIENTATION=-